MASAKRSAPDRPATSSPWHPKAAVSEAGLIRLERQARESGRHRAVYLGWILDHYSAVIDRLPSWARGQFEHCLQHPDDLLKALAHSIPGHSLPTMSEVPASGRTPRK